MKNNHTPKIRFSGFTGDWEQRKLGEISEKVTEKNKNNIYSETLTNSAEFGIINQRDFFDKDISNEKNLDGYYVVRPDDFVYNPRISNLAPVGPIKRNKLGRTGVMSPLYYVFRTRDIDKTYLEKYFSSNSWHIFMKLNGDSGARSDRFAIKDSLFREMPIPIPSIEEQEKIGNFFKQLDDTITLHQQELTTLKQTKQGFLQKMFPKEGESVPEIRFPGFTGDWEQRKFQDFIAKAGKKNTMGENYPAYSVSNKLGLVSQTEQFDGSRLDDLDKTSYKLVNPNEFAYNPARINVGSIAFNNLNKTVIVSSLYVVLKMNEELDNEFILQFIKSQFFIDEVRRNTEGSVREYLFFENFKNIKFPYTSSKDEQIKIGNFFKQLDDTIALHQRELDALKETKKAFLQKMFV
ncbi:type I restriction enzyme, S subunit [Bacillus sp. IT-79MI2]|uniref:restriction endonuclease subunit S n=1 Tax=Bacillus sp. IT-79MI2 TaxID=3026438 RepID=UPI0039E0DA88